MATEYLVRDGEARSTIVVGEDCADIYHFAASEIQKYLHAITGVALEIVVASAAGDLQTPKAAIAVGGPELNPLSRQVLDQYPTRFDAVDLGAEGFILHTGTCRAATVIVVAGAGAKGTIYATYELLERYGVTFEIDGDILPEQTRDLELLALDETMKPAFKYRGLHPFWNHLTSCQTWSLDDFKRFVDQCAKLKFNYMSFHFFPFEPTLSYNYNGEPKLLGDYSAPETGYMARRRYPGTWSTADLEVGREHFTEKWHCAPELLNLSGPEDACERVQDKLRKIIGHAKTRFIDTAVCLYALALPPNLARHVRQATPDGWQRCVGKFVCATDPRVREIDEIRLRRLLETYPEADAIWIYEAENYPVCECEYCRALYKRELGRFGDFPDEYRNELKPLPEEYQSELGIYDELPGGYSSERIDLRADIAFIHAVENILESARRIAPQAKIGVATICHEYLIPYLDSILPADVPIQSLCSAACNPPGAHLIENFRSAVGRELIVTHRIDDDAALLGMQFNCAHYHYDRVFDRGFDYGVAGQVFQVNRTIGHEHNVRYLSEACWSPQLLPAEFYLGYATRIFGSHLAGGVAQAFAILEEMEEYLGWNGGENFHAASCPEINILVYLTRQSEPHKGPSFEEWRRFVARCKDIKVYYAKAVAYLDDALEHLRAARAGVRPNARPKLTYLISKSAAYRIHLESLMVLEEAYVTYDDAFRCQTAGRQQLFVQKLEQCLDAVGRAHEKTRETAARWAEFVDDPSDLAVLFCLNKMMIDGTAEIQKFVSNTTDFWRGRPYWRKVDCERIFPDLEAVAEPIAGWNLGAAGAARLLGRVLSGYEHGDEFMP